MSMCPTVIASSARRVIDTSMLTSSTTRSASLTIDTRNPEPASPEGAGVPINQRILVAHARLRGWVVNVEDGRIDAWHPERTEYPAWQICWDARGVVARQARTERSAAAMRRAARGEPPKTRLVRTTLATLDALVKNLSLPGRSGACLCCKVSAPAVAAVGVSAIGLCWACQTRHVDLADAGYDLVTIPHHACASAGHSSSACGPRDAFEREPWRRDPRVRLLGDGYDGAEDLERWLREHGVCEAVVVVYHGGVFIGLDGRWGFTDVYWNDHRGWQQRQVGRWCRIGEPARHEVLSTLRAWRLAR